ncbi:MAG TPA: hypothetical protein VF892_05625, partial [Pseudonocardiaceae bacterium]
AFLACGKLELVEDQQVVLQLWISDNDPTPAEFPLLGRKPRAGDPLDGLAAVLESFSLVFIDAIESEKPLESYQRLLTVRMETLLHPPTDLLPRLDAWIHQLNTPSTSVDRLVELRADMLAVLSQLRADVDEHLS